MGIHSDQWIRKMTNVQGMVEPFAEGQVREAENGRRIIIYDYDLRLSDELKVFTDDFSTVVDPKVFESSRSWT